MSATMERPSPSPGDVLIEAAAALQRLLAAICRDARPVVGHAHDDRLAIAHRRDRDACLGMPRGILDQIAERLGEVLGLDACAKAWGGTSTVQANASAIQRALDDAYDFIDNFLHVGSSIDAAGSHTRARQMSLYLPIHGRRQLLDLGSGLYRPLAP